MGSRINPVPAALRRMPLRTRLVLAFILLIISSASATIVIGNSVFGARVDALASNAMTLYAGFASEVLQTRLAAMRRLAQAMAALPPDTAEPALLARVLEQEIPIDSAVLVQPGRTPVLVRFGVAEEGSPVSSGELPASLLRALDGALAERTPVGGFAADGPETLMAVAAAPRARPGGAVAVTYVLNQRTELLRRAQMPVHGRKDDRVEVMAFLGRRCVASTVPVTPAHAAVPDGVAAAVLERGQLFAGIMEQDQNSYAAYVPLAGVSGGVVGMLGVVHGEDALVEARRRTTTLFTSLIVGGMVFGFIMTWMFSVWLVSPISHLAEGVTRVSEGDLDYKVRIETADELGQLAKAFNQMVRAVKERDHKLRELTESRLGQVEKQVSIGRLAAGVAHEINNPLTAILQLTSLWLRKMPAGDPRREDLEMVVSETARCRDIVRSLLDFARERPMDRSVVEINPVVRDTVALAKNYEPFAGVSLESRLSSLPLTVDADPKLLQQVFLNLLVNAAEAVEPGGTVRVETDEDSSGGFVQVKIVDNGKGIPKEHINRVFEPFFTTKGTGKGTGLGLSVSAGIVHKHDGTIDIQSEEGVGTTVTVLLPQRGR